MSRFFNTTGPCNPEDHYLLSPEQRLVRAQLDRYIGNKLYWVLHAPRQTGKTTFLQSWMRRINSGGEAVACYVSVERCQQFPEAEDAMVMVCEAIRAYAKSFLAPEYVPEMPQTSAGSSLDSILTDWARLVAPKPLVVLFDEVDVLQDQSMVSFLRQLRGGFARRGIGQFPVSVALVGMRDLRDYLVKSKDGLAVNPGSPFNIKEDSASISNFSREDVHLLAAQHSGETGQQFETAALELVYELGRGQPWLTNAILKLCVWQLCPDGQTVQVEHIREAKELLIQQRAVHLDSLAERLRDPRVKKIVELILTGDADPELMQGDDFTFALDMGLVSIEKGVPSIANPIYREVIARVLSEPYQLSIPAPEFAWKKADGSLDMARLLREFQDFWAQHAEIWEAKADYTEAFPHLLLMAFLQRVVNGGGRVEREYAAGRGRMDLAVQYGGRWSIIEIKLISRLGRVK
ncbi:MAG: AAA-like domain-containing protein, partial [Spirochaetes bacterium]|nr:AAA-like domain-containing protein [Spirochaetota bacterium]